MDSNERKKPKLDIQWYFRKKSAAATLPEENETTAPAAVTGDGNTQQRATEMEIEIPPESGCSSFSPDDQVNDVIQTSDSEQHHLASTSNAPLSQHDNDESGTTDSGPWYRGHKLNVS